MLQLVSNLLSIYFEEANCLSRFLKAGLLSLLVFGFFVLMSRIDYMVNVVLYQYGLRFSYEWANSYWFAYNSIFLVFSAVVAGFYWLGSRKTKSDLKVSIAIFATVSFLALGGLEDLLFFLLWSGGLPSANVVWWWAPWISITGTWNSSIQVTFTSVASFLSAATWLIVLKRPKQNKLFSK
jgi:hypothetical protein